MPTYYNYDHVGRRFEVFAPEPLVPMKHAKAKPQHVQQKPADDTPVDIEALDKDSALPYFSEVYAGPLENKSQTPFNDMEWDQMALDDNLRGAYSLKHVNVDQAMQTLSTLSIEANPTVANTLITAILHADPKKTDNPEFMGYVSRQKVAAAIPHYDWVGHATFKRYQGAYLAYILNRHQGQVRYVDDGKLVLHDMKVLLDDWGADVAFNPRTGMIVEKKDIPDEGVLSDELKVSEIIQTEKDDELRAQYAVKSEVKDEVPEASSLKGRKLTFSDVKTMTENTSWFRKAVEARLPIKKADYPGKQASPDVKSFKGLLPALRDSISSTRGQRGTRVLDWDSSSIITTLQDM